MSAPSVTRSEGWEAYTVRANHEWATIIIRGWQGIGVDSQPREIGEIMIHSSFGAWAYQWGHLGEPFKQWLADPRLKAESAYVAGKFLGSKAYEFDGDATVRDLRQSLLEHRRCGDLTKNDARSIWDWIEENDLDLAESSDPFVSRMQECYREADWQDAKAGRPEWDTGPGQGARDFLAEPWDRIATTLNRQFVGFWRKLWPHFAAKLRDELATGQEGE